MPSTRADVNASLIKFDHTWAMTEPDMTIKIAPQHLATIELPVLAAVGHLMDPANPLPVNSWIENSLLFSLPELPSWVTL
jgi:hypothetical protein